MLERMEKQNRIFSGFDADAIDRTTAADLAEVGSDKWTRYPGCIGAVSYTHLTLPTKRIV